MVVTGIMPSTGFDAFSVGHGLTLVHFSAQPESFTSHDPPDISLKKCIR